MRATDVPRPTKRVLLAACAPDTIVTSGGGARAGAPNGGPDKTAAYSVAPTLSTHFAFFFNARPMSLFQVAIDVVTPSQFSELTKTTKLDVGQFSTVVPSMGDGRTRAIRKW